MGIRIIETTSSSISVEYYESISDGSASDASYVSWVLDDYSTTKSQQSYDQSNNYAVTFSGLVENTQYYLTGTLYDSNGGRIEGDGASVTTSQGDKTVTIYANDGSGQSVSNTVPFGTTITIPDCPFSAPIGKSFVGYAGTSSATSAQWYPGQTTTVNVDRVFYCVWQELSTTLSFSNKNGGSGGPSDMVIAYGSSTTITATPTRSGCTFLIWGVSANYGGTTVLGIYEAGKVFDTNLYPHGTLYLIPMWGRYSLDLSAGPNISSVSIDSWSRENYPGYLEILSPDGITISNDANISCSLSPAPSGYTTVFDGWYTSSSYSADSLWSTSINAVVGNSLGRDVTLYAKATVHEQTAYTVSLQAGENVESVHGAGTYVEGATVTVSCTLLSVEGYIVTFDGWYNASGTRVSTSQTYSFTATGNVTLTARGKKSSATYAVTVTAGDTGIATVSGGGDIAAGQVATVTCTLAYIQGYRVTFDGWYNGSNRVSSSQTYTFTPSGNVSLTAKTTRTATPGGDPTAGGITSYAEQMKDYLRMIRTSFTKLCRVRFLQPDGSTAFALDNNPLNRRSGAFIQDGSISVNLQNGQRRTASITLSNLDAAYDYNVNNVWFGQQIAIDEGLILSDGSEFYIPQGIFYIAEPQETLNPNQRTITYPLVDKWAYLDGTLFGRLEGTYEVPVNTNIFTPIQAILDLDRGNGEKLDNVTPIFTEYYNGMTQELPNGNTASLVASPYTLRVDSDDGTYGDVVLGLAEMVNAWVGYDQNGALRLDPSQDDILDTNKPVLWRFSTDEAQLLGATYTVKNQEVYNDYIVLGEQTSDYAQAAGRAQNLDPSSDTNVYSIGRKTYRETASGYYTKTQCQDLAQWKLKRATVLQKAVSISCTQMMHLVENNLVEITRTDKPGSPTEKHLIQGFTRPLTSTGAMAITAVSVADFPIATITSWPE